MIPTSEFSRPPTNGCLPLHAIIDYHVGHNPKHPWVVLCGTEDWPETTVTYEQLGHAVHRAAHILNPGASIPGGSKIGILASADSIIYMTLIFGAIRAGLVPFPLSPRTHLAGITHLLTSTNTSRAVIGGSSTILDLRDQIIDSFRGQDRPLDVLDLPSLHDLYPELASPSLATKCCSPTPFPHLDPTAGDRTVMILHSSGSTGLPRAIFHNEQGIFSNVINQPTIWEAGRPGDRVGVMALPTFHAFGCWTQCIGSVFTGYVPVLFSPSIPTMVPTPELTLRALARSQCSFLFTVPAFLETWSRDDEAIAELKKLRKILFGGGPLIQTIGDKLINRGVTLRTLYGLTEGGMMTVSESPWVNPEDWNYIEFSDAIELEFIPHDRGDGTYEVALLESETFKPFVFNYEIQGKRVYRTKDLVTRHPTNPMLWRLVGRVDDQIILLNGEKVNPEPIELEIMNSPIVQFAAVFGRERNQIGVLIELTEAAQTRNQGRKARTKLVDEIWPCIAKANANSPSHARLIRQTIVFTRPEVQLPRTAKGTVPRSAAFKVYQSDIDAAYESLQWDTNDGDVLGPEDWRDLVCVEKWLGGQVADVMGRNIDSKGDLFQHGMDSLTAAILCMRLKTALRSFYDPKTQRLIHTISPQTIFNLPSVFQLSEYISLQLRGSSATTVEDMSQTGINAITAMIQRHNTARPDAPLQSSRPRSERVILTGTTGALGSHLLAQLLENDAVERVWALNRKSKGESMSIKGRQRASFIDKQLDFELLKSTKLHFAECDLTCTELGLDDEIIEEASSIFAMRRSATAIIHNAWPVNFNLKLESFDSSIMGVKYLINLAFNSVHKPRLIFTSSISVAGMGKGGVNLLEEHIALESAASGFGYGESKLVSEKLLESARAAGLETCVVRLGQLAGDKRSGSWSASDWVPSIIGSSIAVKCLPDALGTISWIPLDVAAATIVDACISRKSPLPPVIHCAHPNPIPWRQVMLMFARALDPQNREPLVLVPFSQWNDAVMRAANSIHSTDQSFHHFPSTKIQPIIDGMAKADDELRSRQDVGGFTGIEAAGTARMSLVKALSLSEHMAGAEPIGGEHVDKWIRYWKTRGLLV